MRFLSIIVVLCLAGFSVYAFGSSYRMSRLTPSIVFRFVRSPQDRLGSGWSQPEILSWVDKKFLLSDKVDFSLVSSRGHFAATRHTENMTDRGDEDSILQRQKTVESIGIRQELRSPPWLVQHRTLGIDDEYQCLHWGTLFDATKRAWEADVLKKNKACFSHFALQL